MIDFEIVEKLRERYCDIHPLAFHRSLERAESQGELFDMLDTFPKEFPIVWDEETRRWIHAKELTLMERFDVESVVKKKKKKKRREK